MKAKLVIFNFFIFIFIPWTANGTEGYFLEDSYVAAEDMKVDSLSTQIKMMMEHYKQPNPVGIPGLSIPDPMDAPDMRNSQPLFTIYFLNSTVHGLSKFKIVEIEANLGHMGLKAEVKYAKLEVNGNFKIKKIFSSATNGRFNITLIDVTCEAIGSLTVARNGNLEALEKNVVMDIYVDDIALNFTNLGLVESFFQGVMNKAGSFVFNNLKPHFLKELNLNLRGNINLGLKNLKQTFPNSIPPLDLAVAEGRKYVRDIGFDPFQLKDYNYVAGIFGLDVRQIWLKGLASFYRVGNITILIINNTIIADLHAAARRLKGNCEWEASAGFMSKQGSASFTVEHLEIEAKINQSLDVRLSPRLEQFNAKLGNIQLRMDGLGTLDYILELLANVLPNILRYQIVDAFEGLLKERVQNELSALDMETEINEKLKLFDKMVAGNKTIINSEEQDCSGDYEYCSI